MSDSPQQPAPWWRAWLAPAAIIGVIGVAITAYTVFHTDPKPPSGETISLDLPSEARTGSLVNVIAHDGFQAGEQVRIDMDGQFAHQVLANSSGGIFSVVGIPPDASPREFVIRATGLRSGRKGSASVFVNGPPL